MLVQSMTENFIHIQFNQRVEGMLYPATGMYTDGGAIFIAFRCNKKLYDYRIQISELEAFVNRCKKAEHELAERRAKENKLDEVQATTLQLESKE